MRGPYVTLYLDESGGKTWPPPKGKNPCKVYVLAGPIFTPAEDQKARVGLESALRNAFKGMAGPTEFHYGDLINRRLEYAKLKDDQRQALANDVFNLILDIKPPIMGMVIHKDRLVAKYSTPYPPSDIAVRGTVDRFHSELVHAGSLGMITMDTESYRNDAALREIVHKARESGIKLGGQGYQPQYDSKLPSLLNSINFTPSHMSPGVQLADAIAYAIMSHHSRARSERYKQIKHLFAMKSGHMEPKEFPSGS